MSLPLRDLARTPQDLLERLAHEVCTLETLGDLVGWTAREKARTGAAPSLDVIVQDEFTHDVVVGLASDRALVFDAT